MKENCGVARAPVETEAVQHAWVAHMCGQSAGLKNQRFVGSIPTSGTKVVVVALKVVYNTSTRFSYLSVNCTKMSVQLA